MYFPGINGTIEQSFFVGFTKADTPIKLTAEQLAAIAVDGVTFKNKAGALTPIEASQVVANENDGFILGGTGTPNFLRLARNSSQASALTFTFPEDAGTAGYVLSTDGSNNTSWTSISDILPSYVERIPFDFESVANPAKTVLKDDFMVVKTEIHVTTAFDGGAGFYIGVSGDAERYIAEDENDLTTLGKYSVERADSPIGSGGPLDISVFITGTPTVGEGFALLYYVKPDVLSSL
jgi:hypothetical protein